MGTISEKLTYLNETKQELKQAINNLGGSIDDNTTFRQYASQLQNVYDNLPKTDYAEGSNITLSNTLKGKIDFENGIVGYGDTEQNGEPTPTNEVPIQCVTGNQSIVESDGNNNSITYPISLGNNKFYKIGDYADELLYDVENDKVYKNKNIGKAVLKSDMNWSRGGTAVSGKARYYTTYFTSIIKKPSSVSVVGDIMCNYYKAQVSASAGSYGGNQGIAIADTGTVYINDDNYADNLSGWTTWLDSVSCFFYYALDKEVKEEITGTLKDQIKALYNSHSFTGTTILESNGDLPMIIKVRALKGE